MSDRNEVHEALFQSGGDCYGCSYKCWEYDDEILSEVRVCSTADCPKETILIQETENFIDRALESNQLSYVIEEYKLANDLVQTIDSWIISASKAKELLVEMIAIKITEHGWLALEVKDDQSAA